MREKLETLSLLQLREIAKSNGLKRVTTYRKPELIDLLLGLADSQQSNVPDPSENTAEESVTDTSPDTFSEQSETPQNTDDNTSDEGADTSDAPSEKNTEDFSERSASSARSYTQPTDSPYSRRRTTYTGIRTPRPRPTSGTRQSQNRDNWQSQNRENWQSQSRDNWQSQNRDNWQSQSRENWQSQNREGWQSQNRDNWQSQNRENWQPQNRENWQSQNRENWQSQSRENGISANKDFSASSGTGGYVRRTGGYTQSYNQVTPESARSGKSLSLTQQEETISQTAAPYAAELASDEPAHGILEVNPDGFGFLRSENYLTGDNDVYVSPAQIRKFNMKTGDVIDGVRRVKSGNEKFAALLYVNKINGFEPAMAEKRPSFEDLTPTFPDSRLSLETPDGPVSLRILDLLCPIGKGQRGMIVSPPKAGKTTLLKDIAKAITKNYPSIRLIVLLIDERPEEVTDIKECIEGTNVEVIYSTFDEQPDHHKQVAEMVLERAKRLVEHGQDVMILLDSITRLARAYNLTVTPSGRTLSGGLDPSALHMPKKFFGAARNMREGGSLTILASALVETGSRMDDVVFEEFKGTGNMELVLDRRLSERRIFPAIDICKSGTRRDDLLLSAAEQEAVNLIRRHTTASRQEDSVERILDHFARTKNNQEFVESIAKQFQIRN